MRIARLAPALILALAACQKPETIEQLHARMQAESDSARTAIEAANAIQGRAYDAGNVDSSIALYANDIVLMPPGMKATIGKDSVRAMMTGFFASGKVSGTRFRTVSVVANGPVAIERGTFTMTFTPNGGGAAMPSAGKYLAHWHKIDGKWMTMEAIWNDDTPPMAMPAPPAPKRH